MGAELSGSCAANSVSTLSCTPVTGEAEGVGVAVLTGETVGAELGLTGIGLELACGEAAGAEVKVP